MATDQKNARKIERSDTGSGCPVHRRADGVWEIRSFATARAVLRSQDTVQAGLGVETVDKMPASIRRPVLYRDGPEHREDRRQTARFFTPKRVAEHYLPIMHRVADEQIEKLRKAGEAELSELSFHLAIEVASAVIGLTESRPGLRQRLERFFPDEFGRPGFTSLHGLYWVYRQVTNWLGIYLSDVRPAIRARRRQRRDDVISHLLDEGCTAAEILGECITFAAAGMVTTREFVVAAAWHLFTDEELQARYREAEEPERHAVLQEILRRHGIAAALRGLRHHEPQMRAHERIACLAVPGLGLDDQLPLRRGAQHRRLTRSADDGRIEHEVSERVSCRAGAASGQASG